MLICPNCNHSNPDGATQCEACYTDLPQLIKCPNCGAQVQSDATFCGSCGANIASPIPASVPAPSPVASEPEPTVKPIAAVSSPIPSPPVPSVSPAKLPVQVATQLQVQTASFLHVQTQTKLDFPQGLGVIHIGKPNEQIPPDIDVSGFPDSDVVSRVHADIRVEGDAYYIEDVGSSNGTYINHSPLLKGNRHRLRSGDRVALGKGDLMTFIFQLS
ncbi:MAG: FHA domain-containing protein [Snowella sp.]|nr:FHA domain-containing protein [Snowella sp.]